MKVHPVNASNNLVDRLYNNSTIPNKFTDRMLNFILGMRIFLCI